MTQEVEKIIDSLIENEDDDDEELLKDVAPTDIKLEILEYIETGLLSVSGNVTRRDHHYVHQRTTSCELQEEWYSEVDPEIEKRVGEGLDSLADELKETMVGWNHKIYRELEDAYDGSVSDEAVAETILANEYTFDEDGDRSDGHDLKYDQLSPEAQKRAREWWVNSMLEDGDTYYAEPVIAEWKWLLKNKGFNGVNISWSGFWSQGDGASFTAKSIDFQRYLKGPDPLEFPEVDRQQLDESEDEDIDPKGVYGLNRRPIKHIETHADYAEYEERVREFFEREGIRNLSAVVDEHGETQQNEFSSKPCEVCRRPLAGTRIHASGYNQASGEVQEYSICPDCEYYAEYGQLDDTTMLDLDKNPGEIEERMGGAEKERGIWYHGTSSKLIPTILSRGLVTNPKVRAWNEDPNASIVQLSRKSLKDSIYVTTNLLTATGAGLRVAQRDKANQAVVVMSLQPRSMVADEDDVGSRLGSIEAHLSGSAYHHIWPYLMEVYGDRYKDEEDLHLTNAALKMKTDWVDRVTKGLFYKFGEKNTPHPELEKRVRELLYNEGYRAMLERNVAYIHGTWDLSHWKTEWSRGFGTYDDSPPLPDAKQAEDKLLAFNDKLSRALKNMARPIKTQDWSLNQSGRVLKPIGFTGKDKIICIFEIERAEGPDYHSRMIVHYGTPPQKAIDDWRQAINGLDREGDIVYKTNGPKKSIRENEEEDFKFNEIDPSFPGEGMRLMGGTIISQPATQYQEWFPGRAWEIFFAKGDKTNFVAILVKSEDGWHNIVSTPDELSVPYVSAEALIQRLIEIPYGPLLGENQDEDFEMKELLGDPPPPTHTFEVRSSHGTLTARVHDGQVVKYDINDLNDADGLALKQIKAFDIKEWQKYWATEKIQPGMSADILDLGYWYGADEYEPPDQDWRNEIRDAFQEHGVQNAPPEGP